MQHKRKPIEGIEERHSKQCRSVSGGKCSCRPSYRAHIWNGRTNKRERKTFSSLAEAKTWRRDAAIAIESGTFQTPSARTLREEADDWVNGARSGLIRNRSGHPYKPSALRGYERALRLRVLPRLGHLRFTDLRRRDIQELVDDMLADGANPATVTKTIDPLRAIYRRAERRDMVTVNPTRALDIPSSRGRRDRVATRDEAAALIEALPVDDRAVWATAFYAGLRRGELRALRCSDIDLERNAIRVRRTWDDNDGEQQDGKTVNAVRLVFLIPELRRILIAHKLRLGRDGDDLLLGRTATEPFVPSTVRRRALDAWRQQSLPHFTLHEARHTWVSIGIAAGVNPHTLKTTAGHGSYEMTMDHYGKMMPGALEEAAEQFEAYLMSPSASAGQRRDNEAQVVAVGSGRLR